jgi:hypothetical protein
LHDRARRLSAGVISAGFAIPGGQRHHCDDPTILSAPSPVVIQFGGCDGKIENRLPTTWAWKYLLRLYRPHP